MKVIPLRNTLFKILLLVTAWLLTVPSPVYPQGKATEEQVKTTGGGCLSQDEMILFNLVNDLRKQNKLEIIPLSWSLSQVASIHIRDLQSWNPQEKSCSLHSWSEKGPWKACCHAKDPNGTRCMNDKPSELTGYNGKGFELVYWEEESATSFEAFELWKQVEASREMILNKGKWQSKQWKAMGVGIREGYAIIWLGDKNDKLFDITICGVDTLVQTARVEPAVQSSSKGTSPGVVTGKEVPVLDTPRPFYIIVASLATEDQAIERKKELSEKGYPDVIILESNGRYRVSVGSYETETKAKARMKELKSSFPDCWMFRK